MNARWRPRLSLLVLVLATSLPLKAWAQVPAGPEFTVNTYTTGYQMLGSVAHDRHGNFTVVWTTYDQDGSEFGVSGQRFAAAGTRVGAEFQVNTYTPFRQESQAIASAPSGAFVVVWTNYQDGIVGQRFEADGSQMGSEFQVNTYTTGYQQQSSVAADASGFVVVWRDTGRDGSNDGMGGQRFDWSGVRVGAEFTANTYTTGPQVRGSVGSDASGNFVVVWSSVLQDGGGGGVFGQRFDSTGSRVGGNSSSTPTPQALRGPEASA